MNWSVHNYFAAAIVFGATAAQAAVPYPTDATPKSVDRGLLRSLAGNSEVSVTVVLQLRDPVGAENLLASLTTPGDPQFHKFLTPDQFRAKFGPAEADIRKVTSALQRNGLSVERASSTTLRATGTPAKIENAFGVALHQFDVPAQGRAPAYSYRAPLEQPKVPEAVAGLVNAVVGFDTKPRFRPHIQQAPAALLGALQRGQKDSAKIVNPFGSLTVADFAQYYDVQPLYAAGITGSGRTVGIVTLANFTPADAFGYWNSVGLTVDPGRIQIVNIDGGPGGPSDASGSIETTLDVEQSGGVAPAAKIIVYMAPNTSQAFVDAFAKAVDDNTADSISTSWGEWEWLDTLQNSPVTDPGTGATVSTLKAMQELFVQAGDQGQSLFAAAGDDGAYDVNGEVGPGYSLPLSVDHPASDPFITAAGGTTLPGEQVYDLTINGETKSLVIKIPDERVWGWDYLKPLCKALHLNPLDPNPAGPGSSSCGIYPVGGGGGVSVLFAIPPYQMAANEKTALRGVLTSSPGQVFKSVNPPQTIFTLPAHFKGRNVPDVSANADPNTGYIVGYTPSDANADFPGANCTTGQYCALTFFGGTSFVAPQLNGVTALLSQNANGRLGLLNPPLYSLPPVRQQLRCAT
jgi:kumamolisin